MLTRICRDCQLGSSWRSLDLDEIDFFYDGLRPELKQLAKLAKKRRK